MFTPFVSFFAPISCSLCLFAPLFVVAMSERPVVRLRPPGRTPPHSRPCKECAPHSKDGRPTHSREIMAETEKDFDHAEGSAEEHASRSESLLREQHYEDAVLEAEMALDGLPFMARAALTRGRGLLYPALAKRDEGGVQPDKELLHEAGRAFMLASFLDSGCEEAEDELEKLQKLKEELAAEPAPVKDPAEAGELDVIIVGAGAAGIGTALMLTTTFGLDPSRVLLVERGEAVGETFRRWPAEMRFISPSFNQQGWTNSFDLNSVSHGTSLAYSLHREQPSGP